MSEPRKTDPRKTVGVFVTDLEHVDGAEKLVVRPHLVRSSNAIALLRKENPHAATMLEQMRDQVGRECPVHGHLEDPIIGILAGEVAFACPLCSGEEVRRRWAEEPIA